MPVFDPRPVTRALAQYQERGPPQVYEDIAPIVQKVTYNSRLASVSTDSTSPLDISPDSLVRGSVLGGTLTENLRGLLDALHAVEDFDSPARAISTTESALWLKDLTQVAKRMDLSQLYLVLYNFSDEIKDLNNAIIEMELAHKYVAGDGWYGALTMTQLGALLLRRYDTSLDKGDLDAALFKTGLAFNIMREDKSLKSLLETVYSASLLRAFERTRQQIYLRDAKSIAERLVLSTPEEDTQWSERAENLGNILFARYRWFGHATDWKGAIYFGRKALATAPPGSLAESKRMINLGRMLAAVVTPESLHFAKEFFVKALKFPYLGPKQKANIERGLAGVKKHLFFWKGKSDLINDAIKHTMVALSYLPEDSPIKAELYNDLGDLYLYSAQNYCRICERPQICPASIRSLDEGISFVRRALAITDNARLEATLGNLLAWRGGAEDGGLDIRDALDCFMKAGKDEREYPVHRLKSLGSAMELLAYRKEWGRAAEMGKAAMKLLPKVCLRYSGLSDQMHGLFHISRLASNVCSVLLQAGDVGSALEYFEFGRGVLIRYAIDARIDLAQLQIADDDLAKRFEKFCSGSDVDIRMYVPDGWAYHGDGDEAPRQCHNVADNILLEWNLPDFMLPSRASELQKLAADGPIIIVNASGFGSHGIIIPQALPNQGSHEPSLIKVELPNMIPKAFQFPLWKATGPAAKFRSERDVEPELEKEEDFAQLELLEWLWLNYVEPLLNAAGISTKSPNSDPPRVWWIGSGYASVLPFHAAGSYSAIPKTMCMKYIIPSYTPTINCLAHSRSSVSRWKEQGNSVQASSVLVIKMRKTPDASDLESVTSEAEIIEDLFKKSNVKHLDQPSVEEVLQEWNHFDITHFACHGISDPWIPFNSGLLLQEEVATGPPVQDLLTVRTLFPPKSAKTGAALLAYLSACSTAGFPSGNFSDEGIHLISAFQVAGFGHAIGSLMAVDDELCVFVAEKFYASIREIGPQEDLNKAIAKALRDTNLKVYEMNKNRPDLWAVFIHFGA
ncbi:hypothetical protein ABW19_dt0207999 [Dactylella cylindrospora]|nr:hypothetical protein ABW19_dt0207999 [Dactylella cylindrospora]